MKVITLKLLRACKTGLLLVSAPFTAFFTMAAWAADDPLGAAKSTVLAILSYTPEGLTLGADGYFYGATRHGGNEYSDGTVFRLGSTGSVTVLHEFAVDWPHLYQPIGRLLQAGDGNWYGVASAGGRLNGGGLFRLTPSGVYSDVVHFPLGTVPSGAIVVGPDGNFYGISSYGGGSNCGFIYRVTPDGTFADVANFNCKYTGGHPLGSLVISGGNRLVGVTRDGGAMGGGTLFTYSPYGELGFPVRFGASGECANPTGGLTLAGDGWWYGACAHGGANGYGGIFKFRGLEWHMVMSFSNPVETHGVGFPSSELTAGSDDNLYGAAAVNGSSAHFSDGAIYRVSLAGRVKTMLKFTGTNGSSPRTPPVEGTTPGTFFGVTAGINISGGVAYSLK